MSDGDLGGILDRTLKVTCNACGAELPARTTTCSACGVEIRDEDDDEGSISFVAAEPGGGTPAGGRRSIPLERAKNYVALRDAGDGILAGRITPDEFKNVLARIKTIASMGVKVFESDVARKRFSSLPANEKVAADMMERGFRQLHKGVLRMEAWLTSKDANDVRDGWADSEQGWINIDRAQEMALEISADEGA